MLENTLPPKINETRLEFFKRNIYWETKGKPNRMQENKGRVADGLREVKFITGLWPQLDWLGGFPDTKPPACHMGRPLCLLAPTKPPSVSYQQISSKLISTQGC